MKNKIKIFLGGYVNATNAQNLNCLALAKNLDKTKFEVKTMTLFSGNLKAEHINGVQYIKSRSPHRIFKYVPYFLGILWCDIAYLPKGELSSYTSLLLKLFKKKSFITVEGIIDDVLAPSQIDKYRFKKRYDRFLPFVYSITNFLKSYNQNHVEIESNDMILYLGTDTSNFLIQKQDRDLPISCVIIGNDLVRKGITDFLKIAVALPTVQFHIIGAGNGKVDIDLELERLNIDNAVYHGVQDQEGIISVLKKSHLHLFPSRSEGFPKVILETACAGVPSIVYPDYGAEEWISNGKDGFIVENKEEAIDVIKKIQQNLNHLKEVSKNAQALGESFDWKVKVKDWEQVITKIASL